jgi:type IV pilus assembly protein PilM
MDDGALSDVLRELFSQSGLNKRVRVGVANQRTVLRTLELPPVTDRKELAAAVTFQAQDQVPMPLNNAVLDFQPLGIVETPAGPRQRVVLVAAQRDMIEKLLATVRRAGLTPEGVDLSAFALIRSLYRPEADQSGRVLYLNVDGLTNLAIAEGKVCRFTRVVGSGLEGMAAELAERRSIPLAEARELLWSVDVSAPPAAQPAEVPVVPAPAPAAGAQDTDSELPLPEPEYEAEEELPGVLAEAAAADNDIWSVVENGIREISGEVRNSLDFHRSQDGGGDVSHVVLSGAAESIAGFAEVLQRSLSVEVRSQSVGMLDARLAESVSPHRLAIATGLSTVEAPQ